MIIAKIISGLGNQLFQYAFARQLSINRNTELQLDTSFFSSHNLRSFNLQYFNINAKEASYNSISKLTKLHFDRSLKAKVQRKLSRLLHIQLPYIAEKGWWEYDATVYNLKNNIYLDGYWQHYQYFVNLNPAILDELTLKPDFADNIKRRVKEVASQNSVSIHIRRGDYIVDKTANTLMGVLPLSYYQQAISLIQQKVSNPVFYFFSDDPEWVKNESGLLQPGNCVLDGYKDYEDITLMSYCKHNIIANSSFSWWGAFLNRNKEKIVVAPKNWLAKPEINERVQIQFPDWIKL